MADLTVRGRRAANAKMKISDPSWRTFRRALASGLMVAVGAIDGAAKAITPVHGDAGQGGEFSTFAPGEKPIGGTLRRSIHHTVYIDGRRQFSGGETEGSDKRPDGSTVKWSEVAPSYVTSRGIEAFTGTNLEYAAFVHDGTVFMTERPFLAVAFQQERPNIAKHVANGYQRVMRK